MKKILVGLSLSTILIILTACRGSDTKSVEKEDLVVFAAASTTDVLEEIKSVYEKENPKVNLVFNFDSSGSLKEQIMEGAGCDVFISAGQRQMNELDPTKDAYKGKARIDEYTRIDLLENKVTLVVADGNKNEITSFEDMNTDKVESLAIGNEDVPVGQYSQEILTKLGIYDEIKDKISLGSNVREVTSWVKEGLVDAGIVYATDAKVFDLEVVAEADETLLDTKVIYPAAVIASSKEKEESQRFLDFLEDDKSSEILRKYGFSPLNYEY